MGVAWPRLAFRSSRGLQEMSQTSESDTYTDYHVYIVIAPWAHTLSSWGVLIVRPKRKLPKPRSLVGWFYMWIWVKNELFNSPTASLWKPVVSRKPPRGQSFRPGHWSSTLCGERGGPSNTEDKEAWVRGEGFGTDVRIWSLHWVNPSRECPFQKKHWATTWTGWVSQLVCASLCHDPPQGLYMGSRREKPQRQRWILTTGPESSASSPGVKATAPSERLAH